MATAPDFLTNPSVDRARPYSAELRALQSLHGASDAFDAIRQWPGYQPTPLIALPSLAVLIGVGDLRLKHEGHRFELKSFKALGGAYAVERIAAERGNAGTLTVTCATDGNHGRSVAWGAKRIGARAVIFVHATVSEGRVQAIAGFGAEVRRVGRTYDDSVRAADAAARENGWLVVSDTSYPGYIDIPRDVMQGYAVMPLEIEAQDFQPTHVFVPGGVGGLAAAVLAFAWERDGAKRPMFIVVEPDRAACLFESARARRLTSVGGALDTVMAGLACGEPSLLAWQILEPGADAFMTIPDSTVAPAMRALAELGLAVGESGVAGLAGLMGLSVAERATLGLDAASRVLLYGTEGATDPDVYLHLTGRHAGDVEPAGVAGR